MTPEQIASTYDAFIICIRRWMGTWLDLFLFIGAACALAALGPRYAAPSTAVGLLFLVLYYPLLEGLTGRTLGKWLCGLKVVDESGRVPGIGKAVTRTLLRLVEINPLLSGGLPAAIAVFNSKSRQRLGDASARTWVLKNEDLHLIRVPGSPESLGEFTLPGAAAVPGQAVGITYVPPPPGRRPPPLPTHNRYWALPGAMLVTALAIGLGVGYAAVGRQRASIKPVTLTCKKFLAAPQGPGSYHLTGCELSLEHAQYEVTPTTETEDPDKPSPTVAGAAPDEAVTADRIGTLYIPVFADGVEHSSETRLLLRTGDAELKKLLEEAGKVKEEDHQVFEAFTARLRKQLLNRELQGLVKEDPDVPEAMRKQLEAGDGTVLAAGYQVLHEGAEPLEELYNGLFGGAIVMGIFAVGFGALALGTLLSGPPSNALRSYPGYGYPPYPPPGQ